MSDIDSKCDTFSNTSLIVIFLIIISFAGIIYYFYRKNTLTIDNKIDSVIEDINNILKKPINDFKLEDFNNLNKKYQELLTLINTGKSLFPQYFSGYEKILNMKSSSIPSTFYITTTTNTSNTPKINEDLEKMRIKNITNILEKYKLLENKFKNDLLNDPRKKLISDLFNNNISIILDIIKDQICPLFIKPEFDNIKSEMSDKIDKFNSSTDDSRKNRGIIIIKDNLNKITSNILIYIVVLNKLNKKNIPSTFYVESSNNPLNPNPPENEEPINFNNNPTDINPPENEEPMDFNNNIGYMSLIKMGRNGKLIINGEELDMDLQTMVNNNKDLTNQIASIISYYINKIFPGTTFDIDNGWKLPSNVNMNKTNILKIMEHYYNMLCGNQDKLKLYSNNLTNLLIDITDINFS